jgi:hypothetical protein
VQQRHGAHLLAFALALASGGCIAPWWEGTWGSRIVQGTPDTTVAVTCSDASSPPSSQTVATAVTLMLDSCADAVDFSLQFTSNGTSIRCVGTGAVNDAVLTLTGACNDGWTITGGTLVGSAAPGVNAIQFRLRATVSTGGASCSASITGPLYPSAIQDTLCDDEADAGADGGS